MNKTKTNQEATPMSTETKNKYIPIADWDKKKLNDYYDKVKQYYRQPSGDANLLGVLDCTNFEYCWVHFNHPTDINRVEGYQQLGWEIVQLEQDVGQQRSQDVSRMGSSSVIKDHKGGDKMVLMRIPRDLLQLNEAIRNQVHTSRTVSDGSGNKVDVQEIIKKIGEGYEIQRRVEAPELKI